MGFFTDLKVDLSQAVNELMPEELKKPEDSGEEVEETARNQEKEEVWSAEEGLVTPEDVEAAMKAAAEEALQTAEAAYFEDTESTGSADAGAMHVETGEAVGSLADMDEQDLAAAFSAALEKVASAEELAAVLNESMQHEEEPEDLEVNIEEETAETLIELFAEIDQEEVAEETPIELFAEVEPIDLFAEADSKEEPEEAPSELFVETAQKEEPEEHSIEVVIEAILKEEAAAKQAGQIAEPQPKAETSEEIEEPKELFSLLQPEEVSPEKITEFGSIWMPDQDMKADQVSQMDVEDQSSSKESDDTLTEDLDASLNEAAHIEIEKDQAENLKMKEPVQEEEMTEEYLLNEENQESQENEEYYIPELADEKKLDTSRARTDETAVITEGMTITGDIQSEGSVEIIGTVNGNIEILGKLNITGNIQGDSKAAEIYAENAKITGEVNSLGTIKIGQSSVIIGNIYATSAVIAGAVKGDIDVQGPVILDTSAIVMGNIKSKSVQINNGAVIEGMCSQCYAEVNPTSFFEEFKKVKGSKK